jgi:hypothetical protein
MQKYLSILLTISVFIQNINAQENSTVGLAQQKLSVNFSPASLFEYANCLQVGAEYRLHKHIGIQGGFGYYNDIFRHKIPNYEINGIRFGGEVRIYLFNRQTSKRQNAYIGMSLYNNISQVNMLQDGLVLENGKAILTKIPVSFEHQRRIGQGFVGLQYHIKKQWFIDGSVGFGSTTVTSRNVYVPEGQYEIFESNWQGRFFSKNSIWTGVNVFDRGSMSIEFGLKIGYILF